MKFGWALLLLYLQCISKETLDNRSEAEEKDVEERESSFPGIQIFKLQERK